MPSYSFKNKETEEVWDVIMSWEERCHFLEENPQYIQVISKAPGLVGSRYTSGMKNDGGWNETLSRIAEAHPASDLAKTHGSKDSKSVKTRQVVDKWRASHKKKS